MSLTNFLKDLILEELSSSHPIYHFTRIFNLKGILKNNELNASTAIGTNNDFKHNKGKFNFISFQRSGSGKLGYGMYVNGARIVLDKKKLQQNYKIFPIDYWQTHRDPKGAPNRWSMLRNNEMEDRLATDETEISNISKYIDRIDINLEDLDKKWIPHLFDINNLAGKMNIEVYYFSEQKDWENMKLSSASKDLLSLVNRPESDSIEKDKPYRNFIFDDEVVLMMKWIDEQYYERFFKIIRESDMLDQKYEELVDMFPDDMENYDDMEDYYRQRLEKREHDLEYTLKWVHSKDSINFRDRVTSIKNSFHNTRSYREPIYKKYRKLVFEFMKKYKMKSIEDLVWTSAKLVRKDLEG